MAAQNTSSCLTEIPKAIFEGLIKLVSIPINSILTEPNKKHTRPLAFTVLLIFGCCCLFVNLFSSVIKPAAAPAPSEIAPISNEDAMQTAWSSITQTAQADPSPQPTETPTILPTETKIPASTSTQAASSPQACIRPQEPQTATVVAIVDGDTIRVEMDGKIYPVRYIGIDTPETSEPFGSESSQKNGQLVNGQTITMYRDTTETDQFDRLLRFVFVGDQFINYEMVKQGYANAFRYPPDTACSSLFEQAQTDAQAIGVGMWVAQATFEASSPAETIIITFVNKGDEYVDIKNVSSQPIDLNGWRLVSEKGSQSCSLSGTIQPNETLRIWAQTGTGYSCGFGSNIWNNSEPDPAVLYNPQNIEIDRNP